MKMKIVNRVGLAGMVILAFLIRSPEILRADGSESPVPDPNVTETDLEIAGYIYPGMFEREEWEIMRDVRPETKPLLGWYNEGNPEAVDWQVKWAMEAGIRVLFVDWYRNHGVSVFDHWLNAFLQSKNGKKVHWAIMWANHNLPGSYSVQEQKDITQYWLDHYFGLENYYRIDDKPVVLIWDPNTIDRDFIAEAKAAGEEIPAGEGIRRALALSRSLATAAGYSGIHFIALYHAAELCEGDLRSMANAGFDEVTVYSGFGMAWGKYLKERTDETGQFYPYEKMTQIASDWWEQGRNLNILPVIPWVPTGWDCRPRTFEKEMVVTGRTPEAFRKACETAKAFCLHNGYRRLVLGPLNEWQEGSYIEPNEEFGFGMYNVLRDVFAKKPETGFPAFTRPEDVGCGPYDYPEVRPLAVPNGWEFNQDREGWYRHPCGTGLVRWNDGCVMLYRVRPDVPAMQTHTQPIDTSRCSSLRVRMRLYDGTPTGNEKAVFYWGSPELPIFRDGTTQLNQSVTVPVTADGEFHEYVFPLKDNPAWSGFVDRFWFDPADMSPGRAQIDFMRFE